MRQDQSTEPEIDTGDETAPLEPFPIVSVVPQKQSEYTQKVHCFTAIHEINIFYIKKALEIIKKKKTHGSIKLFLQPMLQNLL